MVLIWLFGALVLGVLAIVPLDWKSQAELAIFSYAIAWLLNRTSRKQTITLTLILLSVFSSTRYFYWRVSETIRLSSDNPGAVGALDMIFIVVLLMAEGYTFLILILGYFQTMRPLKRAPLPLPEDSSKWPAVDVFVPTYNEPLTVVRPTVLASLNIDWPPDRMRVLILDDGRRPEFRKFAEECGCGYITRTDNKHAKAGNINNALAKTKSEYIAIFDCDHVPTRSFLQITMGWMLNDSRISLVQTPHHFYSPDPFERNLGTFRDVPNEGALFYGVVQDGNDLWDASFFCGSCAVLRRQALNEIGGIAVETVTEDSHTALRMQRRGWKTAYINLPQAAGLATSSLVAHIGQRIRWARGMVQIFRIENPLLSSGLRLPQRLCYLNACLHYLGAGPRLIFLTSPLVYLLLGRSNILGYYGAVAAYGFAHILLGPLTNSRIQRHYRFSFWNEVYEVILAPYIFLPTTVALIAPKRGKFNVTAKGDISRGAYFDWHIARPYLILLALNMCGFGVGVYKMLAGSPHMGPLAMNLVWTLYNLIMLSASLAVAYEAPQRRESVRIDARFPLKLVLADGSIIEGETENISNSGAAVLPREFVPAQKGEAVALRFEIASEQQDFPASVVGGEKGRLRVKFLPMDLALETELVRLIYGRADSWIKWRRGREDDRPLRSLIQLIGYAFRGFAVMIRSIFSREPRAGQPTVSPQSSSLHPIVVFLCLFCASTALIAQTTRAAPQSPGSTSFVDRQQGTFADSIDLTATDAKGALTLSGTAASAKVFFRIEAEKVASRATVQLYFRSSGNVAPGSKLDVILNNGVPVSIPLGANSAAEDQLRSASVDLATTFLATDNTLEFRMTAKCRSDCGDSDQPRIWVRIEKETTLHISGNLLVIANDLRLLNEVNYINRSGPFQVAIAFDGPPDRTELEAAGIVASKVGIETDFAGARMPVSIGSIPVGDVIFIGRSNAALPVSLGLGSLGGPAIAIRDNPNDRFGKLVLIIGDYSEQTRVAAKAFALRTFTSGGSVAVINTEDEPPARVPYDAPRWLGANERSDFGQSLPPEQRSLTGSGIVRIYFRLPPDLLLAGQDDIPLRIRYSCKNLPAASSTLNISLNGVYVGSRPIDRDSTKQPSVGRIGLPVSTLGPNNTLTLDFAFGSSPEELKSPVDYPQVMILDGTRLDISNIPHFVEMPRLDLFANAGFPFTRLADSSQTAAVLSDHPSVDEIGMYLATLSFFGARTGYPSLKVRVVDPAEAAGLRNKDMLMFAVGDHTETPESWLSRMPLQFHDGAFALVNPHGLLEQIRLLPLSTTWRARSAAADVLAGGSRPGLVIQQFISPSDTQRTVVLVQALTAADAEPLKEVLQGRASASHIFGDVSFDRGRQFQSFRVSPQILRNGQLDRHAAFNYWVNAYFLAVPVVVGGLALLMAFLIAPGIERRAHTRLEVRS